METFVMAHSTIAPRQFVAFAILTESYPMVLSDGVHVVFVSYQFTRIIPMAFVTCAGRSTVVSVSASAQAMTTMTTKFKCV